MKKSTVRRSVVAGFASLTLGAGGLMPAPAHAAEPLPSYSCEPGDAPQSSGTSTWSVNCSGGSRSIIATGADAIIDLLAPDLGIKLSDLNKAIAIPLDLGGGVIPALMFPGEATISGSGFTSAIGVGGTGTATADDVLSGAIGIGALGAKGSADSMFGGLALAAAVGDAAADAQALPGGIALAIGLGTKASALAFGGVAAASGSLGSDAQAICTAVYGTASVSDSTTGKNVSSCTSVMFIFQKSQAGDGPVVYAIKNPFSLALSNPIKILADFASVQEALGITLPIPKSVMDVLGGNIIPEFTDDLIRIVMADDGPRVESDLFGSADETGDTTQTVLAAKTVSDADDSVPVTADAVDDSVETVASADAPTAGGTPANEPNADETPAEAPKVEETPAEVPADDAPSDEGPVAEVPADETPAADAPAEEAPASDAPVANEETPSAA